MSETGEMMPVAVAEEGGELRCVIRSEEDAWDILRRAEAGEFGDRAVVPSFDGWPSNEIVFWLDDEHEVLTAPMMEALLSYQAGLYRSFLLVTDDTTNLRGLSEEERREYQMRFKVGQGCTKLIPDWQALADKFISKVVANMTGTQITITVLGFALLFAGGAAWRAWLDHKSRKAAEEARNQTARDFLAAQRFASEADVRKTELLVGAIEKAMDSRALIDASDEGKQGILRAAARVDSTEVAGVEIVPEAAKRMARNSRSEPELEELRGLFRVRRNDADPNGAFRVRLISETGEEFFAGIRDALVAGEDRRVISEAEWTQTLFWARIEVIRHRGEISSATVVEVARSH
jgi:hypothetical protein